MSYARLENGESMKIYPKYSYCFLLPFFCFLIFFTSLFCIARTSAQSTEIAGRRFDDIVVHVTTKEHAESFDVKKALARIAQRLSTKLQERNFFPIGSYIPGNPYGWGFRYGYPTVNINLPNPVKKFLITDKNAKKGHWTDSGSISRSHRVNKIRIRLMTGKELDKYFQQDSVEKTAAAYKDNGQHKGYAVVLQDNRLTRVSYPFALSGRLQEKQYAGIAGRLFSVNYKGQFPVVAAELKGRYPFPLVEKRHDKGKSLPAIFRGAFIPVIQKLINYHGSEKIDAFFQYDKLPKVPPIGIHISSDRQDLNNIGRKEIPVVNEKVIDNIMEIAARLVLEEFEGRPYRDPAKKDSQKEITPEGQEPLQIIVGNRLGAVRDVSGGDVFYHQVNFAHPVSLPITLKGAQKVNGNYEARVKVGKKYRSLLTIQSGHGTYSRKTADGFKITGNKNTLDFLISYSQRELQRYSSRGHDELLLVPITVQSGDSRTMFYDQIAPEWDIIVTRFLVKGSGYEGLRKNWTQAGKKPNPEDYRFNNYVKKLGSRLDEWNKIHTLARTRPQGKKKIAVFKDAEQVIMGWGPYEPDENATRNPVNRSFALAADPPEEDGRKIPVFLVNSKLQIELGLEIYQHPQILPPLNPTGEMEVADAEPEEGFEDGEGDALFYENDQVTLDTLKKIWRLIEVDDFVLSVHKLNNDCSKKKYLKTKNDYSTCFNLRNQASDRRINDNDSTGLVIAARESNNLFDYFPLVGLDSASGMLRTESTPRIITVTIREVGVYEIRLQMTLSGGGLEDENGERAKKSVDVAVRFQVVPVGFDMKVLQRTGQRRL